MASLEIVRNEPNKLLESFQRIERSSEVKDFYKHVTINAGFVDGELQDELIQLQMRKPEERCERFISEYGNSVLSRMTEAVALTIVDKEENSVMIAKKQDERFLVKIPDRYSPDITLYNRGNVGRAYRLLGLSHQSVNSIPDIPLKHWLGRERSVSHDFHLEQYGGIDLSFKFNSGSKFGYGKVKEQHVLLEVRAGNPRQ